MPNARDNLIDRIKQDVVPVLRKMGFHGSYPNFRRAGPTQVDLVAFHISSTGMKFTIEVAKFPATGFTLYGRMIPPERVRIVDLFEHRRRLGQRPGESDHWIEFANADLADVAAEAIRLLCTEASEYWRAGEVPAETV